MSKKILLLSLAVLFLVLLTLIFNNPFKTRYAPHEEELFFPQLKADDIATIDIENYIQGTRLQKDDQGKWWVQLKKTALQEKLEKDQASNPSTPKPSLPNQLTSPDSQKFPVDPDKINQIINLFTRLKKETLISTNPEKQAYLAITDQALNVTLLDKNGKKLAKIFIGKQGPEMYISYVRTEGSNDVYSVDQYLPEIFNQTIENWQKKDEKTEVPPLKGVSP